MAAEGLPVQAACRTLEVSESGSYAWRSRAPSRRAIRHAWLTDLIRQVHAASRQTYGSRRVHAELTLGRGIVVGYHAVELLMRRAGLKGVTGAPKYRRGLRPDATATDLQAGGDVGSLAHAEANRAALASFPTEPRGGRPR